MAPPRTLGSWGPLLAGTVLFGAAFVWQRWHCPTLRIEAAAATARELAAPTALPVADVMALWELTGVDSAAEVVAANCRRYADTRARLGDPLAAALACEPAATAEWQGALAAAGGDQAKALAIWRREPTGVLARLFALRRERFAARAAAGRAR